MTLKLLFVRETVLTLIRDFFASREFHEVVIPVLNTSLPLEQNIYSFSTVWRTKKGEKTFYLPTSPEAALKKAIAKGIGNCFGIGSSFRNLEGSSHIHNPEFLMLEWYREDANYEDIMRECEELVKFVALSLRGNLVFCKWAVFSMVDLFNKYAKLKLEEIIDDGKMSEAAAKRGLNQNNATWEKLFNQIFLNDIEPYLPKSPFFLTDYPSRISPLCAKRADKPYIAQRFELYIGGVEIANGNTENTNADEVLQRMREEQKYRKKNRIKSAPIDMEFIQALRKMDGKSYAGIGLGIDRLVMLLTGNKSIK